MAKRARFLISIFLGFFASMLIAYLFSVIFLIFGLSFLRKSYSYFIGFQGEKTS
jgi:hypothetical protein